MDDLTKDADVLLKPIFDMLWQAGGRSGSPYYTTRTAAAPSSACDSPHMPDHSRDARVLCGERPSVAVRVRKPKPGA